MTRRGSELIRATLLMPGQQPYALARDAGIKHANLTMFLDGDDAALTPDQKSALVETLFRHKRYDPERDRIVPEPLTVGPRRNATALLRQVVAARRDAPSIAADGGVSGERLNAFIAGKHDLTPKAKAALARALFNCDYDAARDQLVSRGAQAAHGLTPPPAQGYFKAPPRQVPGARQPAPFSEVED